MKGKRGREVGEGEARMPGRITVGLGKVEKRVGREGVSENKERERDGSVIDGKEGDEGKVTGKK